MQSAKTLEAMSSNPNHHKSWSRSFWAIANCQELFDIYLVIKHCLWTAPRAADIEDVPTGKPNSYMSRMDSQFP